MKTLVTRLETPAATRSLAFRPAEFIFLLSAHQSSSSPMTTTTAKIENRRITDSVLADVRRTKVRLLERFNYDIEAMFRDAEVRQYQSGHEVVDRSTGA